MYGTPHGTTKSRKWENWGADEQQGYATCGTFYQHKHKLSRRLSQAQLGLQFQFRPGTVQIFPQIFSTQHADTSAAGSGELHQPPRQHDRQHDQHAGESLSASTFEVLHG
jgi:hypothetical protein